MESFALVRPEHLNHDGNLFGGQLLKWVDETAWLVAAQQFPSCRLVTRAMDDVQFHRPVSSGSIMRILVLPRRRGRTSVTYHVTVFAKPFRSIAEEVVFETNVVFVDLSCDGGAVPLPEGEGPDMPGV